MGTPWDDLPSFLLGKSGRQEIAMRKFLVTYIPASMLLAFLAMVLFTCGGGGDDGGGVSTATLTGLSITGPDSIGEMVSAPYSATASWDDNTTSTVTPTWSVNSQWVSISPAGVLSCPGGIDSDQLVTITATYSSGGITETDTMDVTIINTTPVAWQPGMLLGSAQFEENIGAGDVYSSYLYIFNADSSFQRYGYENPPDTSIYETGTWSINASGGLILTIPGKEPITVTLLVMPFIYAPVLVDEGTGTPYNTKWDWAGPGPYPFDESLIPGTYGNQFGDTWIFDANGTGSTTGDGGWTYTWSVVGGILKVVFPNGYVGSMYELPGSQVSATSYTMIEWAFVLNTPTGEFGSYYGGMRLTRQ
jgi:hypothetical protein